MNFLFTDLHLHSSLSDEDLCNESPGHILSKVQGYVEKYNQRTNSNAMCCISIADHNSTLSSLEAQKMLQEGKFPNVHYINGCEFTVDLSELNNIIGIEHMFTRCHMLAYGYNENDKELVAYSKIAHKMFSNEDNIGLQILAARRAINEKYNINIPFSDFAFMTNFGRDDNYTQEFIEVVRQNLKKRNINFAGEEVFNTISHYLIGVNTYCKDATSFGRIKLSEAMTLTHNAGGKIVLAHPTTLSVLFNGVKQILKQEGYSDEYINNNLSRNSGKVRKDLMKIKREFAEVILKRFIQSANSLCEAKICGLETFNGINFMKRKDIVVANVCKELSLFETAGSDYHGENFTTHKTIGNVLYDSLQTEYGNMKNRHNERNLFVRISNLPFIDYLGGEEYAKEPTFIDDEFNKVEWREISLITDSCLAKRNKQIQQNIENEKKEKELLEFLPYHKKEIKKRINSLTQIAENFSLILNKGLPFKERRKKLVKLDSFCRSVLGGVKQLQKSIREHSEYYDIEDVKRLTTLLKEIHRKYYEMLRLDNGIMYDLKATIKAQYKVKDTSIDKLAHITIKENNKDLTK